MPNEQDTEGTKTGADKRTEKRIKLSIPCVLNFSGISDKDRALPSEATVVSVSRRGTGLVTNVPLHSGDLIEISIQVGPENTISVEGKALWCKEVSPDRYRVGISLSAEFPIHELPDS